METLTCLTMLLGMLGAPLIIVYAIQPKSQKNKTWLYIGLMFFLSALLLFCATAVYPLL